jgi:hypothetical protein
MKPEMHIINAYVGGGCFIYLYLLIIAARVKGFDSLT